MESHDEREAREILQEIFDVGFPKQRPRFLINPQTGHRLELDCYNEDFGLAIEVNGRQHYEYDPYFHRNNLGDFYDQQYRDYVKRKLCKKFRVKLLTIPYDVDDVELCILDWLSRIGYESYVSAYIHRQTHRLR